MAVDAAASVVVVGTHGLPVRPHRPRWPVARQVLGGSERSTDRSQELLRTVCDGYHRYTFGSARALVVGGAGHTTVAAPDSDRVYLANASYRLLLGVPAAVVVDANTPVTAVVTATSTTHA